MATAYPIPSKSPDLPPESEEKPHEIVEEGRSDIGIVLRHTELPPEIDRQEWARRLDVEQIEIDGLSLRPNQLRALKALKEFLLETKEDTGYFIQPTGAGKTFTFGLIAKLIGTNALILVPTKQLIEQTKNEFIKGLGFREDEIGIIQPGKNVPQGKKILISTYGSHVSRLKHGQSSYDQAYRRAVTNSPLVICDEAHRALGEKTSEAIGLTPEEEQQQEDALENIENFTSAQAIKLGFTATPDLSHKSVGRSFQHLIAKESFHNLREAGILVPHRSHRVRARCPKGLIDEKTTAKEEGRILRRYQMYRRMLKKWQEVEDSVKDEKNQEKPLRTIVFCANTEECEKWSEEAQALGIRCRTVTYKQGDEAVAEATEALLRGEIDQIITVNKLAEGFDCRPINCVVIARATNSPVRIAQPVGRGLRAQRRQEDARFGDKELCHLIEGQFMISPSQAPDIGTEEGASEEDEKLLDETEENIRDSDERFLKGEGMTLTFDEYLQVREGHSGEAEKDEAPQVKQLVFDENGIAYIKIGGIRKGIVIPEVYMQNLPYVKPEDILDEIRTKPIELNPGLCRFGNIPIEKAYTLSSIRSAIIKWYKTNLFFSEEGMATWIEPEETIENRRLTGYKLVTLEFIRKRLTGFLSEDLDDDKILKLLSIHGIHPTSLPPHMIIHGVKEHRFFRLSEIEKLEDALTTPESDEDTAKVSIAPPPDSKPTVEFIMTFENGTKIEIPNFVPLDIHKKMPKMEQVISQLKKAVETYKRDKATLRLMKNKLLNYADKISHQGMKSASGARMDEMIVDDLVVLPIEGVIDMIEKYLD